MKSQRVSGFTLVELVIVIVILGILAVVAAPRFIDISTDAKIATLNGVASQIKATNRLVQNKARLQGLQVANSNPAAGGSGSSQPAYIVDFGFGATEVEFRNLCPEARAEDGDALTFFDFMQIDTNDMETIITNRYAAIGYDIPNAGPPSGSGCYVYYDSNDANCLVVVIDADC